MVRVRPRYEWLWVYGFVRPGTGRTEWLLLPRVTKAIFELALAHFAQAVGAGPGKRVILVLDRAGWHTSEAIAVPDGLHLEFLPAYSPEVQPAERLWPLCNEGAADKPSASMAELEEALARWLVQLADEAVRRLTGYHRWPQDA